MLKFVPACCNVGPVWFLYRNVPFAGHHDRRVRQSTSTSCRRCVSSSFADPLAPPRWDAISRWGSFRIDPEDTERTDGTSIRHLRATCRRLPCPDSLHKVPCRVAIAAAALRENRRAFRRSPPFADRTRWPASSPRRVASTYDRRRANICRHEHAGGGRDHVDQLAANLRIASRCSNESHVRPADTCRFQATRPTARGR